MSDFGAYPQPTSTMVKHACYRVSIMPLVDIFQTDRLAVPVARWSAAIERRGAGARPGSSEYSPYFCWTTLSVAKDGAKVAAEGLNGGLGRLMCCVSHHVSQAQ